MSISGRFARHVTGTAELLDEGEFFCPQCKAKRGFQLRSWRHDRLFIRRIGLYAGLDPRRGEFVRCNTCRSAFDPECLDESCTASLESLRESPPAFAPADEKPCDAGATLAEYLDR